jgi:hypothetical protein
LTFWLSGMGESRTGIALRAQSKESVLTGDKGSAAKGSFWHLSDVEGAAPSTLARVVLGSQAKGLKPGALKEPRITG